MSPQYIAPVSLDPSSKGAALITTNTEMSVAPKPDQRSKSTALPPDNMVFMMETQLILEDRVLAMLKHIIRDGSPHPTNEGREESMGRHDAFPLLVPITGEE